MQNLLTKQEPEGAGNTDLHELQKKLSLQTHFPNIFFEISVYTKLNVREDLEFIIEAFSSHSHFLPIVFVYHLISCMFLI